MRRPVRYEELSYVKCTYYKLIIKRGLLGRYVIKILSGSSKNQLSCDLQLTTWNEDTFKRWLHEIILKKYNVFCARYTYLCDLLNISQHYKAYFE
jgi:hypothetical protein